MCPFPPEPPLVYLVVAHVSHAVLPSDEANLLSAPHWVQDVWLARENVPAWWYGVEGEGERGEGNEGRTRGWDGRVSSV